MNSLKAKCSADYRTGASPPRSSQMIRPIFDYSDVPKHQRNKSRVGSNVSSLRGSDAAAARSPKTPSDSAPANPDPGGHSFEAPLSGDVSFTSTDDADAIIESVEDLFLGNGCKAFKRIKGNNMNRSGKHEEKATGSQSVDTSFSEEGYSSQEPSEDLKREIRERVRNAMGKLLVGTPGDPSRPGYKGYGVDGQSERADERLGSRSCVRPSSTNASVKSQPTIYKWLSETSDGIPGVGFRPGTRTRPFMYSAQRSRHPISINFASERNPFASLINHNLVYDRQGIPRELVERYWCHDKVQDELRDDFRIRADGATAADVVRVYMSELPEDVTSEVAVTEILRKRFVGELDMDQYRSMFAVLFLIRCEENGW